MVAANENGTNDGDKSFLRFDAIVRKAMKLKTSDAERAKRIVKEISADKKLAAAIFDDAVSKLALNRIYHLRYAEVTASKNAAVPGGCARGLDSIRLSTGPATRSLLDSIQFSDGRTLRELYGKEVRVESLKAMEISRGMRDRASFLQLVAGCVPDDARVGEKLDDMGADALWVRATKGDSDIQYRGSLPPSKPKPGSDAFASSTMQLNA